MAKLEERTLSDSRSHQIMIDSGFSVVSSCYHNVARYMCSGSLKIDLPCESEVKDLSDIYNVIYKHAYNLGIEQGKNDAVGKLIQNISSIIFK